MQLNGRALHLDQAWVELAAERQLELENRVVLVLLVSLESLSGHYCSQTQAKEGLLLQPVAERLQ